MLKSIFSPEKSNKILHLYHHSNHALIPLFGSGLLMYKFNSTSPLFKTLAVANVANFGFHSYVSTSTIITDYIKPRSIAKFARISSFNFHCLAILGFTNLFIFKK